jgi:hypothetical protein
MLCWKNNGDFILYIPIGARFIDIGKTRTVLSAEVAKFF